MITVPLIDWQPAEHAPRDREVLLWVYAAYVGRWSDEGDGGWVEKTSGVTLSPVRFWANINPPE